MPFYIATVYVLTSMVAIHLGDEGIKRHVERGEAESPEMFEAHVRDRYLHDVDAEIDFGPISLSKKQTHDTN